MQFPLRIALFGQLLLAAQTFAAAPVPVGPIDPLKIELPIPATVVAVIHVNGIGAAKDRYRTLAKAAFPEKADEAEQIATPFLDRYLKGRDLAAITPDARLYLTVESFDRIFDWRSPPVAVVLPVTDYAKFRATFLTAEERKSFRPGKGDPDQIDWEGRTLHIVNQTARGQVVLSPSDETAKNFAAKYEPLTGAKIGNPVASAFFAADVSFYINLARIMDLYGNEVRQIRQLARFTIQNGGGGFLPNEPRQRELVTLFVDAVFQAIEDGSAFTLGTEFRPEGLMVRVEANVKANTELAKTLADEKPGGLEPVTGLPAGQAIYASSHYTPKVLELLGKVTKEFGPTDDGRANTNADKFHQLLAAAEAEGTASAGSGPDAGLFVLFPKDPQAITDAYARALRTFPRGNRHLNVVLADPPEVKTDDQTHAGFTFHRVRLVYDFETSTVGIGDPAQRRAAAAAMKHLVGEKSTTWFGTDGRRFIRVAAKDWEGAKKLLDDYLNGKDLIGADAEFRGVRAQLPTGATFVAIAEIGRAMPYWAGLAKTVFFELPAIPGIDVPDAKRPDRPPAYAGLAVVLTPTSAGLSVYVPVNAFKLGRAAVFGGK